MKIIFSILFFIFFLISSEKTVAQQSVQGRVTDNVSRKPVPNAVIQIAGSAVRVKTNDRGLFIFSSVLPIQILVSCPEYDTVRLMVEKNTFLQIRIRPVRHFLNEIEITATSGKVKSQLYQPASISRLGTEELNRSNGLFLRSAVNGNIPGVYMASRSVAGGQQINIRGYGNGHGFKGISNNFDGQGVKVYYNGIPITDAEGITILDDIDFSTLGNVAVIKGPSGTLYGSAIAGVVNLNTLRPEAGTFRLGQDVMLGSYGLKRFTTYLSKGGKHSSLLVNYGHQYSDGFMEEHTLSRKDFVNVSAALKVNDKETFQTYFGYTESYEQRAGELTPEQYENKDYSGNPDYIKNDAHSEITGFRAGLSHHYAFNKHFSNSTTVFASGNNNNSSSAAGWTDKAPVDYGFRSTFDLNFDWSDDFLLSGTFGMEVQSKNAAVAGYRMIADSSNLDGYNIIGNIKSDQSIFASSASYFTAWTLSMPYHLSLTAGIGLSTLYLSLHNRLYQPGNKNPVPYAANYNDMFAPHIAINKVFDNKYSVYLSYSKGYRPPVSGDILITATGELNTDLKPETGSQWEIGTKGNLFGNDFYYELAAFYVGFTDKMTSIAVPLNGTRTAYTYTANGGDQLDKGLELSVSWTCYQSQTGFLRTLHSFANLCYSDYKYSGLQFEKLDKNKEPVIADFDGKAVAGVAPVTANIGIDLQMQWGIYANIVFSHRDGMPITSDGIYQTSAYNLLHAKIGIKQYIGAHFDLNVYFGANNITGTQYYYMVFLNQLPDAYLPAPDRINYYGGIGLSYRIK